MSGGRTGCSRGSGNTFFRKPLIHIPPARRLLECATIAPKIQSALRQQLHELDPFVLKNRISRLQTQLLALVSSKNLKIQYPGPAYPQATERMGRMLFG
jgi:hypothetical protein